MILLSGPTFAQVSVFSCDAYNDPTQAEILNSGGQFYRGCVDLSDPGNYLLQQSFAQEIKATTNIHVTDVFHAGPYTGNANAHLVLGTASPFDVVVMNYSILNNILRYKKFELGIVLPEPYQTYVENFEAKENNPSLNFPANEMINPFLEWELDVEAHFTKVGTSTEIVVDGFFTNEIERDYNENYWNVSPSNYPMRVRFAPPENGNWQCYIVIKIGETGTVVSTSATIPFTVVESGNKGFVSVHENQKNLERGGEMIFPVGQNFPSPNHIKELDGNVDPINYNLLYLSAWSRYIDRIEDYIDLGGKYIRTCQVVQGNLLEWEKKGNYYGRLHYAWEQDKLLELLEQHDVQMLFTLMNQEPFMNYGNYRMWTQDWDYDQVNETTGEIYYNQGVGPINPYNDNPNVKEPYESLTNLNDLKYHKQRTRYYIARYGYSTSIYAFELLNEPAHIGQYSEGSNVSTEEPYLNPNDPHQSDVKNALAVYTNAIGDYIKNHLHHTNQLFMINAVQPAWNPNTWVTDHDQSIYSQYVDIIGLNFYDAAANKLLKSGAGTVNENGQTKCVSDFWLASGKPIFLSESGSGDFSLNCAEGAGENIDVMTFGFTQVAGFNMWHALYGNQYNAYQANIRAMQHMNAHTLITLSNGSGQWVQRRQVEKHQSSDPDNELLKENQYYVSSNGLSASGFVRNRSYNVGRESNPYDPNCLSSLNPNGSIFNTFQDISWVDGTFNKLKVKGLMNDENFIIEYYSYFQSADGGYIGYESQPSSSDGELTLHHPDLLTYTGLMPIVWYIVYLDPNGLSQNANLGEASKTNIPIETFNGSIMSEDNNVLIFPNPALDELRIQAPELAEVIVYDLEGKMVIQETLSVGKNVINVSLLSKGMYTIQVLTATASYVYKISKN